jgi:hypothetical protein
MPLALISHYKAEEPRKNLLLHIVTGVTCFGVFIAMLFKILHWPFAGTLLLIALPLPYVLFLPVFLITTARDKNFSIYNVVFVLALLAFNSVFSTLLALNVSKERIDDSYILSQSYIKLEKALDQLPVTVPETDINKRIDDIVILTESYREKILKSEGMSAETWTTSPGNLWRPDSRSVGAQILEQSEGADWGVKLETSINELIKEMVTTSGYEEMAKAAPAILLFNDSGNPGTTLRERLFRDNTLSWTLIDLDALSANLKILKRLANAPVR